MEELQGRLWFAQIHKADLQKQAKGLRKAHLRDCLVKAIEKKQHKQAAAIKKKCNREESKRMWYLIMGVVLDHWLSNCILARGVGTPQVCRS